MEELYKLDIKEIELNEMIETNADILNLEETDICNSIELLKQIGCSDGNIKDIIISNPFYLNRVSSDVINLANKLREIGLTDLNLIFDSNPYLLNKNDFEINEYIEKEIASGKSLEDIVSKIEDNPYTIDEEDITN